MATTIWTPIWNVTSSWAQAKLSSLSRGAGSLATYLVNAVVGGTKALVNAVVGGTKAVWQTATSSIKAAGLFLVRSVWEFAQWVWENKVPGLRNPFVWPGQGDAGGHGEQEPPQAAAGQGQGGQ